MAPEPCPERYLEPRGDSGYRPWWCCLPVGHPGLHRTDTDEVVVWGSPGRIAQEDPCRLAVRAVTALLVELDEDVGDVGVRDDLRAVVRLLEGMPPPDHFDLYIDQQRRRLDAVADTAWRRYPERMLQVAEQEQCRSAMTATDLITTAADDDPVAAVDDLGRRARAVRDLAALGDAIAGPGTITLPTILGAIRSAITTLEGPDHA